MSHIANLSSYFSNDEYMYGKIRPEKEKSRALIFNAWWSGNPDSERMAEKMGICSVLISWTNQLVLVWCFSCFDFLLREAVFRKNSVAENPCIPLFFFGGGWHQMILDFSSGKIRQRLKHKNQQRWALWQQGCFRKHVQGRWGVSNYLFGGLWAKLAEPKGSLVEVHHFDFWWWWSSRWSKA